MKKKSFERKTVFKIDVVLTNQITFNSITTDLIYLITKHTGKRKTTRGSLCLLRAQMNKKNQFRAGKFNNNLYN